MIGLIVYGSLLHKNEIYRYDCKIKIITKVKINNYKRCFNLLPSVRVGIGNYKSVLNIMKSPSSFLNGICIIYEKIDIREIDEREKGYNRVKISSKDLVAYDNTILPKNIEFYTYVGLKNKIDSTVMPNVAYLKLCLEASMLWGNDFYDDFVNTTYLNNDISLIKFIKSGYSMIK